MRKLTKEVVDYALELGFVLHTKAGERHLRFDMPGTKPVFCSSTPSCGRAVKNMKADLRRAAANCG